MRGGPLLTRYGHWRQQDRYGNCLWPRTYHDDHGVTHAVLLSFDGCIEAPIMFCTGHRAYYTGVDEGYEPLTCLMCIVKDFVMPEIQEADARDE